MIGLGLFSYIISAVITFAVVITLAGSLLVKIVLAIYDYREYKAYKKTVPKETSWK